MWQCPICRQNLSQQQNTWRCESNHCFDQAKEGYLNLLPVNQKNSRTPGDSKEMIAARRSIHQQGLYQPLADAIVASVAEFSPKSLLEIGCGEGFYTKNLAEEFTDTECFAIDIAKPAVRLAAKSNQSVHCAVASSFSIPLPDSSLDLIVRVFAPSKNEEVVRLLSEQGVFCVVTPAENHLLQIRQALYHEVRLSRAEQEVFLGLEHQTSRQVTYQLTLNHQQLNEIIQMTPFAHKGQQENRTKLLKHEQFTVDMAFNIDCYAL